MKPSIKNLRTFKLSHFFSYVLHQLSLLSFLSLLISLLNSLSRNHPLLFLSTFHLVYWILWSFILNVKAIAKKFRSFRCGNIKTKNVKRLYSPLKMNEYPHKYINFYNQILKMIHLNTSTQKYKLEISRIKRV